MDYISYSQYKTYTSCPRSWYLSKIRKAEEKQTWYIPVGTAVHNMIEDHLSSGLEVKSAAGYFYPLIEKQLLIEPDMGKWLAGGPKADPTTEDKALQLVKDCYERALQELDEIDVWAVEHDASGRLPGLSVPVRGFIDIVGEHKKKGPIIVDWKTGSTKPDNFQLETYAALLYTNYNFGVHVSDGGWKGRYAMLAPGKPVTRYVDLSTVDPEGVAKKYQRVYDEMQAKKYQTNAGFTCQWCFNQDNCLVNAGQTQRATYYDRSAEDGLPF